MKLHLQRHAGSALQIALYALGAMVYDRRSHRTSGSDGYESRLSQMPAGTDGSRRRCREESEVPEMSGGLRGKQQGERTSVDGHRSFRSTGLRSAAAQEIA